MPFSPPQPFSILAIVAFPWLFACQTAGTKTEIVSVETTPPGAVLSIASYGECETPCTVEIDRERAAVIAKAGFEPVNVMLKPGERDIVITLKLAAPTESVDESALPEIK